MDLFSVMRTIGIPESSVRYVPIQRYRLGLEAHEMAALYQSFDVLLAASGGEGFCVPLIEAQACGVPVIVSDFAAQAELVGDGWIVGGQRRWIDDAGSWLFTPSVREVVDALESANERSGPSAAAADFAVDFDGHAVFRHHWLPFLHRWLGGRSG